MYIMLVLIAQMLSFPSIRAGSNASLLLYYHFDDTDRSCSLSLSLSLSHSLAPSLSLGHSH